MESPLVEQWIDIKLPQSLHEKRKISMRCAAKVQKKLPIARIPKAKHSFVNYLLLFILAFVAKNFLFFRLNPSECYPLIDEHRIMLLLSYHCLIHPRFVFIIVLKTTRNYYSTECSTSSTHLILLI